MNDFDPHDIRSNGDDEVRSESTTQENDFGKGEPLPWCLSEAFDSHAFGSLRHVGLCSPVWR